MKFDITQQSAFASLVTLFFISVLGIFALVGFEPVVVEGATAVVSDSLLGGFVLDFQHNYPVWSAIIASGLILYSSIWLGYIISVQSLYGVSTSIQLIMISILLWCTIIGEEYLLAAIIASLSVQVTGSLLRSVRSNNYSGHILNASLSLSLLPALYAPSVALVIFVPILWIVIGVTLRELLVSLVGLLLPFGWVVYLFWLCGFDLATTLGDFATMVVSSSSLLDIGALAIFANAVVVVALLLSLLSLCWISGNVHHTRMRLVAIALLGLASLLSLLVPSATPLSLALAAPILATLASFSMAHMRGTATNIIYFGSLVLLLASMFIPLYLRLEPLGLLL